MIAERSHGRTNRPSCTGRTVAATQAATREGTQTRTARSSISTPPASTATAAWPKTTGGANERKQPLAYLVEKAIDTGRIAGLKPSAATGIAEAVAEMIAATLREGEGVKFGDYFTVRMYLDGTVDGPLASLGAANNINAKIITGSKLKISRDMFSFRNVNATGDDPFIDEVQSDVDGAVNGIVRLGDPLAVIGSFLQLGEDDVVNVYRKAAGSQETVSCGSVAASALTTNSNKLLRFPFAAIPLGGEMRDGDAVFFEVSKQVTLPGGQTATQLSNRFTATASGTAPVPGPSVTAVFSMNDEMAAAAYDVIEEAGLRARFFHAQKERPP